MQKPIRYLDDIRNPNDPQAYWVFVFHGYGADASDLRSLSDVMTPESKEATFNWVFPNGVFEVPIGGMWTGKAWWPLTLNQLQSDWTLYSPPEIEDLKRNVFHFISSFGIPWNRIIFAGFSQGAMLATELYLSAPETPAGLMSLSGTLIRKTYWQNYLEKRKSQHIFLSHGEQDNVLPSNGTHKLIQLFKQYEYKCDFASFKGGHEIPSNVILKAKDYLDLLSRK